MSGNINHPKKGSVITVEPIRDLKDIKSIKAMLQNNPRDLCLFTLGINTNLRASDLLRLKVSDVRGKKPGDDVVLREKKTSKVRRITLNKACVTAIKCLLASKPMHDEEYLFSSQRGEVLTVPSVTRLVKSWCAAINLKGNYGSHTLRKTFGYHQRKTFNVSLPELMVVFNHSTQRQTLDYLCISEEEVKSIYLNEI